MFEAISKGKRELRCLRISRVEIEIRSKSVDCMNWSSLLIH